MAAFGADGRCLMRTLQEELDDPDAEDCGRCSVCTAPRFAEPPDPALVEQAQRYLRSRPVELEVKKMAPDAAGTMRKIPEDARIEPGWALARFGDGGWWPAVERGLQRRGLRARRRRRARRPPAQRGRARRPGSRPSRPCASATRSPAGASAWPAELGVPHLELLARAEAPPAAARDGQRRPAGGQRARRVQGDRRRRRPAPGVLLDDRRSSGWTLAMVGRSAAPRRRRAGRPARTRNADIARPLPCPTRRGGTHSSHACARDRGCVTRVRDR